MRLFRLKRGSIREDTISERALHWHKQPPTSTFSFVEDALLQPTGKGLRATLEITAYPPGHVEVRVAEVDGKVRPRQIRGHSTLMFNDIDEAKDAVDLLIDRVASEAAGATGNA